LWTDPIATAGQFCFGRDPGASVKLNVEKNLPWHAVGLERVSEYLNERIGLYRQLITERVR
jgi:hypothetical protein